MALRRVEEDLVQQERSNMTIAFICLMLFGAAVFIWFLVSELKREHQRRELLKKNMSFMESLSLTGLPIICFNNNGQTINMVLDTGSNICIIDSNILKNIIHSKESHQIDGIVGISGEAEGSNAVELILTYKDASFKVECYVNDLADVASAVKQEYGVTIHGLLGTDFFAKYKYIIDFNEMVAYSLKIN